MKKTSVLIAFLFAVVVCAAAYADMPRTVKVGFFPSGRFNVYDSSGNMTGYNVDYLAHVARRAGWRVEYVRADNWSAALKMFEAGKTDILAPVQLNPERGKRYAFSIYPSGNTYGALITLSGNKDIVYEDFKKFGEIKIGCLKNYVLREEFKSYAARNGFVPRFVDFRTPPAMFAALASREVDAVATNLTAMTGRHKMLAKFSPAPFYYVTQKYNSEVLRELNEAVIALKLEDPDLENRLNRHYYGFQQTYPYSRGELDFISGAPTLNVALPADNAPLSYKNKEGGMCGIIPDIYALASRESGLRFTFTAMGMPGGETAAIKAGDVDLIGAAVNYKGNGVDGELRLTSPFMTSSTIFAGKPGLCFTSDSRLKIAVADDVSPASEKNIRARYPNSEMIKFPSPAMCMDAVKNGVADVAANNVCVIGALLQRPKYGGIVTISTTAVEEQLTMAAAAESDPRLLSILDKTIKNFNGQAVENIINAHTIARPNAITLEDLFYKYKTTIFVMLFFLAVCLGLLCAAWEEKRKNMRLTEENAATLKNISNNINGGVITLSEMGRFCITYANDGFLGLVGYSRGEFDQKGPDKCVAYIHPDDAEEFCRRFGKDKEEGECISMELRIMNVNGSFVYTLFRGTAAKNAHGDTILYCVMLDITEEKKISARLKSEMERYQLVVEQSNDIIFDINVEDRRMLCSTKYREVFGGKERDEYPGDTFADSFTIHPDDMPVYEEMLEKQRRGEGTLIRRLRLLNKKGDFIWCDAQIYSVIKNGVPTRIVGKITDVSTEVREHERLKKLSQRDPLTGLYNKGAFKAAVETVLENSRDIGGAVFFMDLDNFKRYNDTFGHMAGDDLLRETGQKLNSLFRKDDVIGRFGGDEFCVFMTSAPRGVVEKKAQEMLEALVAGQAAPDGRDIKITVSIGAALVSRDDRDYDLLMEKADTALYRAKELGKNNYVLV